MSLPKLNHLLVACLGFTPLACDPFGIWEDWHGGGGGPDIDGVTMIDAKAGFSCDFDLAPGLPPEVIGPTIERDRMYMSDQPGMLYGKHLPLAIDPMTGDFSSGGRYLFETKKQAAAYAKWVTEDYILDGVQFLEREGVLDPHCFEWTNIGAFELGDVSTDHIVMRTERWSIPNNRNWKHYLQQRLPDLAQDAVDAGLTGVWLLYNRHERLVEIVYIDDRVAPPAPGELDFGSIFALASVPTLGAAFDDKGWTRVLDRTHFVLSIWFQFEAGDNGEGSLWPNSPPLPEPFCGDGVCSVSRGEANDTCAVDCTPTCGDAECDPDEGTNNCPGDCRIRPEF